MRGGHPGYLQPGESVLPWEMTTKNAADPLAVDDLHLLDPGSASLLTLLVARQRPLGCDDRENGHSCPAWDRRIPALR